MCMKDNISTNHFKKFIYHLKITYIIVKYDYSNYISLLLLKGISKKSNKVSDISFQCIFIKCQYLSINFISLKKKHFKEDI